MTLLSVFALVVFILPFAFPTPPPIVTRFSGTRLFSPNGDGARDVARFSVRMRESGVVTLDVADEGGTVVRTLLDAQPAARGWLRPVWDGRDAAGARLSDGVYSVRLYARSGRKNFKISRRVRLDTIPPEVTSMDASAPDQTAAADAQCVVEVGSSEDASASLEARPTPAGPSARPVRGLGPRPVGVGDPLRWAWNGLDRRGRPVAPGLYTVTASLRDPARNPATAYRTCWIGNLVGRISGGPPSRGGLATLILRRPDGTLLPAGTRVRLRLFRRSGTPGLDTRVLGPRVARAVVTTAADAAIRLPVTVSPEALWIVADAAGGRALVHPGRTP